MLIDLQGGLKSQPFGNENSVFYTRDIQFPVKRLVFWQNVVETLNQNFIFENFDSLMSDQSLDLGFLHFC